MLAFQEGLCSFELVHHAMSLYSGVGEFLSRSPSTVKSLFRDFANSHGVNFGTAPPSGHESTVPVASSDRFK
jgi:hypothetical protein